MSVDAKGIVMTNESHVTSSDSRVGSASIAVVVTTLGRTELLEKLLDSLRGQLCAQDRMVIVAQRNFSDVHRLVSRYEDIPIEVATSALGASTGRNAGVNALGDGEFAIIFPNDSTWYPPGAIEAIRARVDFPGFRAAALMVVDELGPKLKLLADGAPLSQRDVWRVIEMGLVMSSERFRELGGFDQKIGTGADSPWQSGEAADLLLRAMERDPRFAYEFRWFPREIWVGGVAETFGLDATARRRKLRAYGRGAGKVARDHSLPVIWRLRLIVGGFTLGFRNPQYSPLDGLWAFTGRCEGLLGRTFGGKQFRAVDR